MKARKITRLLAIAVILISISASEAMPVTTTIKAKNYQNLQPTIQNLEKGGTDGQPLDNLFVKDQSSKQNNHDKYITFTTPNEIFKGTRDYSLPVYIPQEAITGLKVIVNFRGPIKTKQAWIWMAYNWTKGKWIKIGDNGSVTANKWKLLTFVIKKPQQYMDGNGLIRILTKSNNASGNAKIDYESVRATYPCLAQNNSYPTTCAEEDNINVPIFSSNIIRFKVTATHPEYEIGTDNCSADFSGCNASAGKGTLASDVCETLKDDGKNVVKGCNQPEWWRPYKMQITVENINGDYDYLVLYEKIKGKA